MFPPSLGNDPRDRFAVRPSPLRGGSTRPFRHYPIALPWRSNLARGKRAEAVSTLDTRSLRSYDIFGLTPRLKRQDLTRLHLSPAAERASRLEAESEHFPSAKIFIIRLWT